MYIPSGREVSLAISYGNQTNRELAYASLPPMLPSVVTIDNMISLV